MTTPVVQKREEFRKYLERSGLLDALTRSLVSLYDEVDKPEDSLEYLRSMLGDERPPLAEIEAMKAELAAAKIRLEELELEVKLLRGEIVDEEEEDVDQENNKM